MTDVTDVFLWYLILGGYIVHHGGLRGAWEDVVARFKHVAGEPGRKVGAWLDRVEGRDL